MKLTFMKCYLKINKVHGLRGFKRKSDGKTVVEGWTGQRGGEGVGCLNVNGSPNNSVSVKNN